MLVFREVYLVLENKGFDVTRCAQKGVSFEGGKGGLVGLGTVVIRWVFEFHTIVVVDLKLGPAGLTVQAVAVGLEADRVLVFFCDVARCQTNHLKLKGKILPDSVRQSFDYLLYVIDQACRKHVKHVDGVDRVSHSGVSLGPRRDAVPNVDAQLFEKLHDWV